MRPTKTKLRQVSNYIHVNDWTVKLNKLPAKVSAAGFNINDDLHFRATSFTIPKKNVESIEVNVRGQIIQVPGQARTNSPIDMEVVEDVDQKVIELIKAWNDALADSETGVSKGTPEELKTDITLTLFSRQGKAIRQYILKGAWITDNSPPQLTSDDDVYRLSISIHFDSFEEKKV